MKYHCLSEKIIIEMRNYFLSSLSVSTALNVNFDKENENFSDRDLTFFNIFHVLNRMGNGLKIVSKQT